MAINPSALFPGQSAAPDADYPLGSAQNITSPGDGTGTPWVAPLINDIWGLLQKILSEAGIVASGDADTVVASQYYQGLEAKFDQSALGSLAAAGLVQLVNTLGSSDALGATQSLVNAVSTALTPVYTGDVEAWRITIGKLKIQGGRETVNGSSTENIDLTVSPFTAYTAVHLTFFAWVAENNLDSVDAPHSNVVNLSTGRINNSEGTNRAMMFVSIGFDS